MTCRSTLIGAAALAMLVFAPATAGLAQQPEASAVPPAATAKPVISADEISYEESTGVVIANGHVEIVYGERMLTADQVRYDQRDGRVVAEGNVVISDGTGEVLFADKVELSDDLRDGVIEDIRILLADDSRFAANGARRVEGRRTIMRRAVFSPCSVCEGDDRAPLWQLKAGTIVHDEESQDVSYRNVWLELYGVPVLYSPYLTHPDPTVERRSGMLAPRIGTSTAFGGYARLPMFLVINDSIDMTVEPILTIKEPGIMALEYRQRVDDGQFNIAGSITRSDREYGDPLAPLIEQDAMRGHVFADGRFDINDDWRWGFDANWAADRTYLDRYDFFGTSEDTLTSRMYAETFDGRSYGAGNVFSYQDLRLTSLEEDPLVLPLLDYNFVGLPDSLGGRWNFDANFRSTLRQAGPNTRRLALGGGYLIPFIADFGLVTTVSASVEADGYHLDGVTVGTATENNMTAGRVVPRLAVEWRYPFVRGAGGVRQLIEPVAAVVAAPTAGNPGNIPPEDSVVIELDDTNLFSPDRIPGIDRADTGQRAVYGLRGGLYGEAGGSLVAFIGQSYRIPERNGLPVNTDIREGYSDYVGRLDIVPNKYFDLLYRFRLAEANLELLRSELGVALGPPALRLSGDYIFIASEASAGLFPDREEVNAELTSQLTDFWRVGANSRFDMTSNGGSLEHGARITYEDECFQLELRYRRDFTSSVDIEPGSVYSVQFVFKNLGDMPAVKPESK